MEKIEILVLEYLFITLKLMHTPNYSFVDLTKCIWQIFYMKLEITIFNCTLNMLCIKVSNQV